VAEDAVGDAARPDRVPIGHDVDREHRLAEPAFGFRGHARRRQCGPQREQCVDVVPVEFAQCAANVGKRHLRDQARRRAFEALEAQHVEARFSEIRPHHLVAARLVRREDRDLPRTELVERGDRSGRSHRDADAGAFRQIRLQFVRGGNTAPERLQRDPHDEVVERGGHDLIDRGAHPVTHHLHVFLERLVGAERAFLDGDAAGVARHPRHEQPVGFGLDRRIGRGHHDADALSISDRVGQDAFPVSMRRRKYRRIHDVTRLRRSVGMIGIIGQIDGHQ
jgi:hypothetical protein